MPEHGRTVGVEVEAGLANLELGSGAQIAAELRNAQPFFRDIDRFLQHPKLLLLPGQIVIRNDDTFDDGFRRIAGEGSLLVVLRFEPVQGGDPSEAFEERPLQQRAGRLPGGFRAVS